MEARQDGDDRRLVDHWVEMPEWGTDRRLWSFYFTFEEVDVLHERIAAFQGCLHDAPGLDLVTRPWLHMTVLGTVFADEVEPDQLDALRVAVATVVEAEAPVGMRAGAPSPSHDALLLPVVTSRPLGPLRERLRAATEGVVGRDLYRLPEPLEGFNPHVTFAYARVDCAPLAMLERLLADAPTSEIRFTASHLSLVRLRRGSNRWSWDQETRLLLKGQDPSASSETGGDPPAVDGR